MLAHLHVPLPARVVTFPLAVIFLIRWFARSATNKVPCKDGKFGKFGKCGKYSILKVTRHYVRS